MIDDRHPPSTPEPVGASKALEDFPDFFVSERPRLFGTMAMVLGERAEAEELTQEAFIKVWERWDRVTSHPDPVGYLYRTAFNLIRQRRRRLKRAASRHLELPSTVDVFERVDAAADVADALRLLTVRQRAALVLTDLLDFDSTEAGRLLGVKPGTVRSLASQGRSALRTAIGDPHE